MREASASAARCPLTLSRARPQCQKAGPFFMPAYHNQAPGGVDMTREGLVMGPSDNAHRRPTISMSDNLVLLRKLPGPGRRAVRRLRIGIDIERLSFVHDGVAPLAVLTRDRVVAISGSNRPAFLITAPCAKSGARAPSCACSRRYRQAPRRRASALFMRDTRTRVRRYHGRRKST